MNFIVPILPLAIQGEPAEFSQGFQAAASALAMRG
jgi:hypothetical protein